jgi:hypothetical protein
MLFPIPHLLLFAPLAMFCAVALAKAGTVLATEFLARPKARPPAPPCAQIIYLSAQKTSLASVSKVLATYGAEMPPRRAANGG